MTGKSKIGFWTIAIIIIIILATYYGYVMISEYNEEYVITNLSINGYDEIIENNIDNELLIVSNNNKYGIIDYNGNIIEDTIYDFNDIKLGYDNYYKIVDSNGNKLIKRNNKVIKDVTYIEDPYLLIKDDNNGEYIIYIKEFENFATLKIDDNTYIANVYDSGKYFTKILDINNGIVKEINGYTSKVMKDNSITEKYLINIDQNKVNLLDIFDYSYILTNYERIGDEENISGYNYSGRIVNDNYIPVCLENKCGLVNSIGQFIIEMNYDNVNSVKETKPKYISVEKDKKFGVIDLEEKEIIPFKYDNIYIFNDVFILVKDNILTIETSSDNKIYTTKLTNTSTVEMDIVNDAYAILKIKNNENNDETDKIIIIDAESNMREFSPNEYLEIKDDNGNNNIYYATYHKKNNELTIDIYDGLSIVNSYTIIEPNEFNSVELTAIDNNGILVKMSGSITNYYALIYTNSSDIITTNVFKRVNLRKDLLGTYIDVEDNNLIYYQRDLISHKLEENVIEANLVDKTDNKYIVKKIDNTVYLYLIDKR